MPEAAEPYAFVAKRGRRPISWDIANEDARPKPGESQYVCRTRFERKRYASHAA